ncbi:hypothetical protein [Saccharicrinis aurantiacus]|uniref:hypothetical protein n=1 Tax=Saccharicrinis aurantiacus TaxID=1849719 RepID=UPI00111546EB|nr:hypothetical protein [Saccharicrinis aurantiacus]
MKLKSNTKTTYLLLSLVIILWSIIVIRIFSFKSENDNVVSIKKAKEKKLIVSKNENAYILNQQYPDPFFRKVNNVKKVNSIRPKSDTFKISKTRMLYNKNKDNVSGSKNIPSIVYIGEYSNTSKNTKVAIVSINEARHIVGVGASINEFTISEIFTDSIKLLNKKDTIIVVKVIDTNL